MFFRDSMAHIPKNQKCSKNTLKRVKPLMKITPTLILSPLIIIKHLNDVVNMNRHKHGSYTNSTSSSTKLKESQSVDLGESTKASSQNL